MMGPGVVEAVWRPWLQDYGATTDFIVDRDRADQILAELLTYEGDVAFDLETAAYPDGSALDPTRGYARLAQFFRDGAPVYVLDLEALGGIGILAPLAARSLVTFAGVFECKWLLAAGFEFSKLDDAALA